jgi:hypothetical protein
MHTQWCISAGRATRVRVLPSYKLQLQPVAAAAVRRTCTASYWVQPLPRTGCMTYTLLLPAVAYTR